MKAAVLALLVLAGPALAEKVATAGDVEIRLFDSPCVHAGTLARLRDEWRPHFRKAQATVAGQRVFGCWIAAPDQVIYWLLLEGGDGVALRADLFEDRSGT